MPYYRTIRHRRTPDLSHATFQRLTVIAFAGYAHYMAYWTCRCECGSIKDYRATSLKNGDTKSCGCLNQAMRAYRKTTHGKSKTVEYRIWLHMISRCHNKTDKSYPRYGGRGITVCDAWRYSFPTFLHDIGKRPTSKHSIERIDNNAGYSPENTIWATSDIQVRNTRRNVYLTHENVTLTLGDWAKRVGIKSHTLAARLRLGWPLVTALTTTPLSSNRLKSLI